MKKRRGLVSCSVLIHPELSKIRNSCQVELLLDDLIRHLRRQTFTRNASVKIGPELRLDSSFSGNMDYSDERESSDDLKLTPRNKGRHRSHFVGTSSLIMSPESLE